MTTWTQYAAVREPTEKQIAAYCKKHNIDFNAAYSAGDWKTVETVLNVIAENNIKKHLSE